MRRRHPRSTRTATLFPDTTRFRSTACAHRLDGVGGTRDGGLGELAGVRVAGRLAGDGAQAEALLRVEAGRLQTAVVEGQRFRLPVLEEQLPVVGTVHGIVPQGFEPVAVEAGPRVEKLVGGGEVCHQAGLRAAASSDERRVGKEGGSRGRTGGWTY